MVLWLGLLWVRLWVIALRVEALGGVVWWLLAVASCGRCGSVAGVVGVAGVAGVGLW